MFHVNISISRSVSNREKAQGVTPGILFSSMTDIDSGMVEVLPQIFQEALNGAGRAFADALAGIEPPEKVDTDPGDLEEVCQSSLLPMRVKGGESGVLEEVIVCDGISGGACYENDMPGSLTLVRRFWNDQEVRANYHQVPEQPNPAIEDKA